MPEPRPLRALVCDRNPIVLQATCTVLESHGYEIVAVADNAVDAIRLNELSRPSFIVINNDQVGLSGLDAIADLRRVDDPPEVLLVASDSSIRDRALDAGAHDLAVEGDGDMLDRMITEVTTTLATGERRLGNRERRVAGDRRQAQDWSKVVTERRSGEDRRQALRRENDVTTRAKDVFGGGSTS